MGSTMSELDYLSTGRGLTYPAAKIEPTSCRTSAMPTYTIAIPGF